MDDNLTAVLMLGTLELMLVAMTWFICRARVKVKRLEREYPLPPTPEPWPDGYQWREEFGPPQTPLTRDVTKIEGEN